MNKRKVQLKNRLQRGFTIVELLIVIVVIAILAAIGIAAYNGIQGRAIEATLQNDLKNASTVMEMNNVDSGAYPAIMPAEVRTSDKVTLTLKGASGSVYTGLAAPQNGLLFVTTCQELIGEGLGAKPDDNHDYVSGCVVFNKNQVQVNGWNGRTINTPVTSASLASYVSSYSGGSGAEFREHGQAFMDELVSRFQAHGGQFPVTSFWDSWATPTNGGVVQPTLPVPTGGVTSPDRFCIEATYSTKPDLVWHIQQQSSPSSGPCET